MRQHLQQDAHHLANSMTLPTEVWLRCPQCDSPPNACVVTATVRQIQLWRLSGFLLWRNDCSRLSLCLRHHSRSQSNVSHVRSYWRGFEHDCASGHLPRFKGCSTQVAWAQYPSGAALGYLCNRSCLVVRRDLTPFVDVKPNNLNLKLLTLNMS